MDLFGLKTQERLTKVQQLLLETQQDIAERVKIIEDGGARTAAKVEEIELRQKVTEELVISLQKQFDDIRDSAIRGEVASGVPSKVVAQKFGLSPSRVTQIAPRRRYNNG